MLSDTFISKIASPVGFFIGADGLALNGNDLLVVNNAGLTFVSEFTSSDDFTSVTVSGDTYARGDVFPTTVVNVWNAFMINYSYFNYLVYGDKPENYWITKVNFDSSMRYSGTSLNYQEYTHQ